MKSFFNFLSRTCDSFRLILSRLEDRFRSQKARRAMWVAALRSGEFKQATGCLRTCDDGYCCLGVLTEIYRRVTGKLTVELEGFGSYFIYSDLESHREASVVLTAVQGWVGLKSRGGAMNDHEPLVEQNDRLEKSFAEIADIIESEPEGLFVA